MSRDVSAALICVLLVAGAAGHAADKGALSGGFDDPYYKDWPLFHFYPAHDVARFKIDHIGPVGIGLELRQPAFTMHVISVEPGSPAAAAGKLKPGQIIESINGKVLKDIDPRVILGNLITEAEARDGLLKMMVKDSADAKAQEVIVKIPVLGAYSNTWPMNCPKSDKIVRNFADFLARVNKQGYGAALFLLSTGEEKDLEVVRGWFSGKLKAVSGYPWDIGYNGPAVCEYYLRTGDASVLPAIKAGTESLKKTIYNGSWMGRAGCNYNYMAGGHMNAAGVHCLTFLLLAKECGVDVDEHTLQSCLYHFYRYAGHWNVSYGDGLPEGGGVDNGKNGGLAFAMAAAASLTPEGENSVYAKARDANANKSFYTTSWLFHGHTGGGIGEIWRGASAGLLAEKRPNMYRSFMNERRWMYELARRHDGAFGWASGMNVSYGSTGHRGGRSWGNLVPLVYTISRRQLRIHGAPRTKYSKPYQLPKQPWGNEADQAFYSLEPGEYKPGKKQDMSEERLPTHASWPMLRRLKDPEVSDDVVLMYAHHPDSTGQGTASGTVRERPHLIPQLLRSKDPRARYTAALALKGQAALMTDEVAGLLVGIINNKDESWWVSRQAMEAMGSAKPDQVAKCYDRLASWLKHEDWWMRHAAMQALTPLAVHKDYYRKILPVIGETVKNNTRAVALSPMRGIIAALKEADPGVQVFAVDALARAYVEYPTEFKAPGGQDMSACVDYMIKGVARNLANAPGGFDRLYEASRKRFPNEVLPHKELYMGADASTFGPAVKEALEPIVVDYLIPKYIGYADYRGANADYLLAEAASEPVKQGYRPKMEGLVSLYNRLGVHDYDWHDFGPDRAEIEWEYHTFDPPEEKIWEPGWRYRKVTDPKGMEDWFQPGFDAEAAGWKRGFAPFGQLGGKLGVGREDCTAPFCRCAVPMKTFWEKEVLIMRTKLKLPPFKEDHRYRLLVGGMSHVQGGDGFEIYVNGKLMHQRKNGVGKRQGGRAVGYTIDKTWWPDFEKEVTIAARGFLPIPGGKRSPGVKRNHFSVFLQEMKVPPITGEMIQRGKSLQPMRCTEWQTTKEDEDKYRHDGMFVRNKAVMGDWTQLGKVRNIGAFVPGAEVPSDTTWPLQQLSLRDNGRTDKETMVWSGDRLMDLEAFVALRMTPMTIDGTDYLFIEAGGFSTKERKGWNPDHPEDWTPELYVMKRR